MAPYKIPTNQFQEYKTSVHWEALTKRGDLSAPSCASCHGNHGAKPPQVESVSAVCGSCHVLFEQLYEKSVHNAIFSGAGGGGGCMVCHSNHARPLSLHRHARRPESRSAPAATMPALAPGRTPPLQMAGWLDGLDTALKHSETVLASAEKSGMEVSEAQVRLIDGRENLVKARLALHSMKPARDAEARGGRHGASPRAPRKPASSRSTKRTSAA